MDFKKPINIFYMVIIVASVLMMVILLFGYKKDEKKVADSSSEAVTLDTGKKEDKILVTTSIDTVEDGLKNMGILITQEYYFTQVETYTKEKAVLNIFPSSSEFSYSYDGTVTAGIDFEKIALAKDDTQKKITVEMPASVILDVNIDTDTFKTFSEKDSIWNPIKLEDYNISLTEFEDAAKQKAKDNGILERSDEQARTIITSFTRNFPSVSDYRIEFKQIGGL